MKWRVAHFRSVLLTVVIAMGLVSAPRASSTMRQLDQVSEAMILSDGWFIYPSSDAQTLVEHFDGSLKSRVAMGIDGKYWPISDMVESLGTAYGVTPEILLSIVELSSSELTRSVTHSKVPTMLVDGLGEGVDEWQQLRWLADSLSKAFYRHYNDEAERAFQLKDGTTVPLDSPNSATYAIKYHFASIAETESDWREMLVEFRNTFASLFGDPVAGMLNAPHPTQQDLENLPILKLPWQAGDVWYFTGGPHWPGGGVDFWPGTRDVVATDDWVVAAGNGMVLSDEAAYFLRIDHDGDGDPATGWQTIYGHTTNRQKSAGDSVNVGDRLGNPSEYGGYTNTQSHFPHLHFGIKFKNVYQSLDQKILSGWTIHQGRDPDKPDVSWDYWDGRMTKADESERISCNRENWKWDCTNAELNSDNDGDNDPPNVVFTGPQLNQWYNEDRVISWTINDNRSGVSHFFWEWDDSTPDNRADVANGSANLKNAGQGKHTIFVNAYDRSGNSKLYSEGWLGYDTQPPKNPVKVYTDCDVPNDIWQNSCNGPAFVWEPSIDENGIGVKDYHYYWGEDPNGQPNKFTSVNGFVSEPKIGETRVSYLRVAARDKLGQESLPSLLFTLRYDAAPPQVSLSINGGAHSVSQTSVSLLIAASDMGSGVDRMRFSNNGVEWSPWQEFQPSTYWSIPALNKTELRVFAQVRDQAGNQSAVSSDTITLDLYPAVPHSTSYRVCANSVGVAGGANLRSANYRAVANMGEMSVISGNSPSFGWQSGFFGVSMGCRPIEPLVGEEAELTNRAMASGGGMRSGAHHLLGDTVGEAFAQGSGRLTSVNYLLTSGFWGALDLASGPLELEPTPTAVPVTPTATPTPLPTSTPAPSDFGVTINSGAQYTNSPNVGVEVLGPNISEIRLSSDKDYANDNWQPYRDRVGWVIESGPVNSDNNLQSSRVYAWIKDIEGAVHGVYSDDIVYDNSPPEGGPMVVARGQDFAVLYLPVDDSISGVTEMRISRDPRFIEADWQAYANTYVVEALEEELVVYIQFRDGAGNLSTIYSTDSNTVPSSRTYLPLTVRD